MVYFLLPAFNEEKAISEQLKAIRRVSLTGKFSYTVYVVDDGSKDKTKEVVKKYAQEIPIVLLEHDKNKGVGEAFRTGFKKILTVLQDEDIVITMDADNTQDLSSARLMIKRIQEGYEVALGSIYAAGGMMVGVTILRKILSWSCNWIYHICFPISGIKEYTGFYRAHSAHALKAAFSKFGDNLIESNGFGTMAEMLIKLRSIPLLMTEVPMIIRYDFKEGTSKIKIWPTICEHLSIITKNLFSKESL